MQFQADILGTQVIRPKVTETTAMGAAYLAGLATGFWKDKEEIARQWQVDHSFAPAGNEDDVHKWIKGWSHAVKAVKAWAKFSTQEEPVTTK
jgi:glycerol kinase